MTRLIAFLFCIAGLCLLSSLIKTAMVLTALMFALLLGFMGWAWVHLFLGPRR